jgi:three-Cys-motif partner protein
MEVEWAAIEAIARTQAIDLWLLFPLGIAVNRLLSRSGHIDETLRERLNGLLGTKDWYNAFYETKTAEDLFGTVTRIEKKVNLKAIGSYFVERLKTVFPGVADNPLPLKNSRNCPLYLLCFAAGNPKGSRTAVKIAQNILRR